MTTRKAMPVVAALVAAGLVGTFTAPAPGDAGDGIATSLIDGVRGGQLWDKWWVVTGDPEPVGDHPLYPPAGTQTGSTTWRCKECHGWDYKGVDGAYGSGSHFTGIIGVFGSTLTAEEMFDLIKLDGIPNGHGFGAFMSDDDIDDVVEFVQDYVIDTDSYIDAGVFTGDVAEGRLGYKNFGGFYACAQCHGDDGTEINFGTPGDPVYLEDIATGNPWEFLHKARIGQPGTGMPSWLLNGGTNQEAADVGAYVQGGFPPPAYMGDQACSGCHSGIPEPGFFEGYMNSGHPWKLYQTGGQVPDPATWPFTPVPPLPTVGGTQLEWSDVEFTIGNYFWKTRYIRPDGFIYIGDAGDTTQWNIATQEFVAYHAGEPDKPYNCGRCHTTGYEPEGNQLGLPGLIGTWAEDGVRCEACHGPSEDHVLNAFTGIVPPGGKSCDECHYRDTQFRMPWKSGFMRHHQQSEDFIHSPHASGLKCVSCHNPHKSTVYQLGGLHTECTSCHAGDEDNGFYQVAGMDFLDCKDCHMPYMGKSATASNAFTGDIRGHLFRIMTDPISAADNTYEEGGSTFWNQDETGAAYVTLDYACLGCHMDFDDLTIEEAATFSFKIHDAHPVIVEPACPEDLNGNDQVDFADILVVIGAWGPCGVPCPEDLNDNGQVDFADILVIIGAWGPCP
ncbi:MAG: hypothetical protein GY715_02245 [Planctomycetes bacterium]|nr:hypothetical protein [Planctomycetota bacterium]